MRWNVVGTDLSRPVYERSNVRVPLLLADALVGNQLHQDVFMRIRRAFVCRENSIFFVQYSIY